MVGKLRSFGPVGVVHKTSSCDRADKGSSPCGVPRNQFSGETLPIEGTRLLNGEGLVRCELSRDEEPSIVARCVAAHSDPRRATLACQAAQRCAASANWSAVSALRTVSRLRCVLKRSNAPRRHPRRLACLLFPSVSQAASAGSNLPARGDCAGKLPAPVEHRSLRRPARSRVRELEL